MSSIIHPTAVLGPNVIVGDNVCIGPYCVIGTPPEWEGREGDGKGVIIHNGTRITDLVTIHAGADGPTVIGPNCYILAHAHIGHDCKIGANVRISCHASIGGHTVIGDDVNVGLNAVIHQRQTIAEGVMIGAQAMVTKGLKTEPYKVYAGNPDKYLKENQRHHNYTIYMKDSI